MTSAPAGETDLHSPDEAELEADADQMLRSRGAAARLPIVGNPPEDPRYGIHSPSGCFWKDQVVRTCPMEGLQTPHLNVLSHLKVPCGQPGHLKARFSQMIHPKVLSRLKVTFRQQGHRSMGGPYPLIGEIVLVSLMLCHVCHQRVIMGLHWLRFSLT